MEDDEEHDAQEALAREDLPDASAPQQSPGHAVLPPELAAVPRALLDSALHKARVFALRKTASRALADDLVQDVFMKIATTRRWDETKGPLDRHFLLCMKSELSHRFTSKAPEREAEAVAGFLREEVPDLAPSAEAAILDKAREDREEEARRANAVAELEMLRVRIADHELMPKVLACREQGIDGASRIAAELGVPVQKVYRAIDLIKYHLKKIREERAATRRSDAQT
jgi:DNA-directed RNA polymerase specialized sigma24 family protein